MGSQIDENCDGRLSDNEQIIVLERGSGDMQCTLAVGGALVYFVEWLSKAKFYKIGLFGRSPQPRVLHLEKYDTWWLNFFCKNLGVRSKNVFQRCSGKLNPSNLERIERLKGIDLATASPKLQNASDK